MNLQRICYAAPTVAALLPLLTAQTQPLRGAVSAIPNSNQFLLATTRIPLVSATVDLAQWANIDAVMGVVDIGTPAYPQLEVRSIAPAPRSLQMTPLRSVPETWWIAAPPGSVATLLVDVAGNGGYRPFGAAGVFLLGPNFATVATGVVGANGRFAFGVSAPPSLDYFQFIAGQAIWIDATGVHFSNPDLTYRPIRW